MFALSAFRGLIARVYFGQLPPLPLSPCLSVGLIACLFVCCWHKVRIVSEGWSKSCKLIENTLARFSTQLRALHVSRVVQLWLSQIRSANILNPPPPPPSPLSPCLAAPRGTKRAAPKIPSALLRRKLNTPHATLDSRLSTWRLFNVVSIEIESFKPCHAPRTPPPTSVLLDTLAVHYECAALKVTSPFSFQRFLFAFKTARVVRLASVPPPPTTFHSPAPSPVSFNAPSPCYFSLAALPFSRSLVLPAHSHNLPLPSAFTC